ncbi:type I-C CRISPR-associated endonuclease Cas1c [Desulfobotulus sp. H1]|uniref:CRISPR-associated endonuclease Cas1 n=1 Tax=Desulfobotulus pelophilus TaxID=2823377 RepID=A0ABT3NAZ7_9BACT|nr:type I-C CRISPR-associated endonuclease Cas1c [Desulfobotulus pelophilus]MCW7754648.1 type I-C CRISPR-associated endonuclease Cas1c [Desulfobotulus pelophilus]
MKPLQNILYITKPGAYLSKERETIRIRLEEGPDMKIPIHGISGIVCFGTVGMSPWLMGFCAERNVAVTFLTDTGRFLAKVHGPLHGNVLLRRAQYRAADIADKSGTLAAAFVAGKLYNCRQALLRCIRDHGETPALRETEKLLSDRIRKLTSIEDCDTARGMEGDAARSYFSAFPDLIRKDDPAFAFSGRNRRPPKDAVNALLSLFYTLLVHDVRSALETVGLDSAVGFLHKDRPGRPSLALDMMEELRPVFCDRLTVSLINREQVRASDFLTNPDSGAVTLEDEARKRVLAAWQKMKQETLTHPFTDEKIAKGLIPFIQARLLARHLRGDLDGYPPFLWR